MFYSQIQILLAHEYDGSGAERANLLDVEYDGEQGDHHEDVEIALDDGCQPSVALPSEWLIFLFQNLPHMIHMIAEVESTKYIQDSGDVLHPSYHCRFHSYAYIICT